jgi:hypothetical protein
MPPQAAFWASTFDILFPGSRVIRVTPIVQAPTHATRPDRAGAVHRCAAVPHMPAGSVFRRQAQLSRIHGGGAAYRAFWGAAIIGKATGLASRISFGRGTLSST